MTSRIPDRAEVLVAPGAILTLIGADIPVPNWLGDAGPATLVAMLIAMLFVDITRLP